MFLGAAFLSIGGGVLSTLHTDSGSPQWIGYQVILGAGCGMAMPMVIHSLVSTNIAPYHPTKLILIY